MLELSHPVFPVPDIRKTAAFYCEKLGFRRVDYLQAGEPHICLYRDMTEIILTDSMGKAVLPNRQLYGYGYDAYFITSDQEALEAELREKGVLIPKPLYCSDYHNTEFVAEDCDGRWLGFGKKNLNHAADNELAFFPVRMDELHEVMTLIDQSRTRPFCPWNEHYPTEDDIASDILNGDAYCMKDNAGKIVSYIARDRDPEEGELSCWSRALLPGASMSRLTVAEGCENREIARKTMLALMEQLRAMGFRSARYLVADTNLPALRSYAKLAFSKVGETDLFGFHFLCYEKALEKR